MLAPPTKHYRLVGDTVAAPSNPPDRQHNRQKGEGLPSAGGQYRYLLDRTNSAQMVGPDHVSAEAQCYAICAIDNLNSELEVNRSQPEGQTG